MAPKADRISEAKCQQVFENFGMARSCKRQRRFYDKLVRDPNGVYVHFALVAQPFLDGPSEPIAK